MKTLKVVLISLVVIFACLVVGLFIFLKTVDMNRYLPLITEQVNKATGRELKIGRAGLNFSFFKGVTVDLKDIMMSDDPRFSDQAFLKVGGATLGVDLGAILGGKIVVTEIAIDSPKVTIIRDKEGRINVALLGSAPGKPAASSKPDQSASAAALPMILVRDFHIDKASVIYIDQMFTPALSVPINDITVVVRNFSLTAPFDVSLKAAAFSADQDISMNGRVGLDLISLGAKIENMKADVDLGKVALDRLIAALPMLQPAGLKEMKGALSLSVQSAVLDQTGLKSLKASLGMSEGRMVLNVFPIPVESIAMNLTVDERNATVKDLSCAVSGGEIRIQGTVKDYLTRPQVDLSGTAEGVEAKGISEAYKLPVKANGKVTAGFRAGFSGMTPEEIMRSLDAEVKANMKEGSLEGINLLQTGLANIPMLPGILASVQSSLPPETQADLEKGVTLVKSCDTVAKSKGGVVNLEKAELVTRDVSALASGTVHLTGDVDIKVDLFIEKALAEALVKKVKDLAGLETEDNRLYIPLFVKGPLMKPQVQPDTAYLSKKLLLERGKDELQKVLEKNPQVQGVLNAIFGGPSQGEVPSDQSAPQSGSEGSQVQPADQGTQPGPGETNSGKAVDALFNAIFEKK
jgi:uncharacterized protein involved in outer membrane biogenesis